MNFNSSRPCYYSNSTGLPLGVRECIPGLYCPLVDRTNPFTIPTKCEPSLECYVKRLYGRPCTDGVDGAQGKYEPVLCEAGYYCPTPQEKLACPSGYFCPTGTVNPIQCDSLAICKEGAVIQKSFTGMAACAALDLVLLIILGLRMYLERKRVVQVIPEKDEKSFGDSVKKDLVENFNKAMDGKSAQMDFRMENVSYTLPKGGKTILQGVSGDIRSGRMTAIMGPSGAGSNHFNLILS